MMHADLIEVLRMKWLTWRIRESGGICKATRMDRDLTDEELREKLALTLMADSAEELQELLAEQGDIEAKLASK